MNGLTKNKKVFVGLSGGVDSSVTAYLLKKQGYDVVGVYFKSYKPTGDISFCRQEGKSAQKVAQTLGIPFKVYDLSEEYKKYVFDYLIESYKKGLTPNPDIACNKYIKFGVFAQKAFADGADYIATGHYAKVASLIWDNAALPIGFCRQKKLNFLHQASLCASKDKQKDQIYFLSQINPDILDRVIFPIGSYKKNQVRKIAKQAGLHTYNKKDSQGMCFIPGTQEARKFLKLFIPVRKGPVIDTQGKVVGEHDGVSFYTISQRRGFSIFPQYQSPNQEPLFVLAKDTKTNTLVVGTKLEFERLNSSIEKIYLDSLNFFVQPSFNKTYKVRIRHRGQMYQAILQKDANGVYLKPKEAFFAPARGQFAAIYKGRYLIGSGAMSKIIYRQTI